MKLKFEIAQILVTQVTQSLYTLPLFIRGGVYFHGSSLGLIKL